VAAEEISGICIHIQAPEIRADAAEGTMAFQFDKPPGFDFKPGTIATLVDDFMM